MTEADWWQCQSPEDMLNWLQTCSCRTPRKLGLWGCACVRRVWHLLSDERSQKAVLACEAFVEGEINGEELEVVGRGARQARDRLGVVRGPDDVTPEVAAASAAHFCTNGAVFSSFGAATVALAAFGEQAPAERVRQVERLRDVFGPLPFRAVYIDRVWRTAAVLALAQATYEQRSLPDGHLDKERLAVLADALEESGCDNEEVLAHLRLPGAVHVRGCFVIDLLLGKE